MKSIFFAFLIIYSVMVYISKPVEINGREELKHALKNYSVITK